MSLLGTLAKVAVGVALAKGVSSVVSNSRTASANPGSPGAAPGGLENIIQDILGGGQPDRTAAQFSTASAVPGGLGGLLEQLAGGGAQGGTPGGGLDSIINGLSQGGLGDLLAGLGGGAAAREEPAQTARPSSSQKGFGELLNQSLKNRGEPEVAPTREQEALAALMLRAMVQAAKSDGKIDETEKEKLMGSMGDMSSEEKAFLKREFAAPVDVAKLVQSVPRGLGPQVYTMSVMAITPDNRNEQQYLHQLAQGLGIDQAQVNTIHARLGVPPLYS
jgi:uncharacterized membrane protein YebE (DUF533 family)